MRGGVPSRTPDFAMVRGLKLISLRRSEVTVDFNDKKWRTSYCKISTIHYHTTKQLPPVFWKFAKVKTVMDNNHLRTTHPPSINSPKVVENFSWYDEVLRAEEAGELAIDDTPVSSEDSTSRIRHEPVATKNYQGFVAAKLLPAANPQKVARKSRQGSGSKQRQKEKFQEKQDLKRKEREDKRRLENRKFEDSVQQEIARKYGLPSTPKPQLTQVDLLTNLVHVQERRDAEMSTSADHRRDHGLSRKSLNAYLKILKSSHKSVLSEPLDMSSFTKNLEDSEDVSSYFKKKVPKIWTRQDHHSDG